MRPGVGSNGTLSVALLVLCAAAALRADTLILNDGTKVEGTIAEETSDTVVMKVKFGQVPYKKSEIKEIQRAGAAAASGNAADLRDVLVLKSGEEHRGLLVEEGGAEITFDLIMSGKKVSKTLLSRTTFQKGEVAQVKKLSDAQRAEARAYIENVDAQTKQDAAAEQNVKIETITWTEKGTQKEIPVRKVELENFIIESNTDEDFVRRAAYKLGKVFSAYKQHFGVDRNQSTKVRVLIFNSMGEFYATVGGEVKNPAFYTPKTKMIWAGCDCARLQAQIADIRKDHAALDTQLRDWKFKLSDARVRVAAFVGRVYDQAKAGGAAGKAQLDAIKQQQSDWQLKVGEYEKRANEIQDQIAQLNRRNDTIFNTYTEWMFAMLYHEGCHAFIDNFLFDGKLNESVPRWLHEGLAQYFECARMEGDRFILGQEDRRKITFLRKCRKENKLVPPEQVIDGKAEDYHIKDPSDIEHSHMYYLESWSLVHLLGEKGRLNRDTLQSYVKQVEAKKPPADALLALAGMTREQLTGAWEEKMRPQISAGGSPPEPKK